MYMYVTDFDPRNVSAESVSAISAGVLLSYRGATAGKGQKWSMVAVAGRRSPAISDQADPRRGVMSCVFLTRINALSTLDRPFLSPAQSPATKKLLGE